MRAKPRFPELLTAAREAAGLTQAELAARAGVTLGTLQNYEQGRRPPLLWVATRLARALGIPLDSLADDSDRAKPAGRPRGRPKILSP